MIKHIVMWKFQPGKDAEVQAFLDGLRGLYGVIPQIREQEVGVNCAPGNYDASWSPLSISWRIWKLIRTIPATRRCPRCARPSGPTGWPWIARCNPWRRVWTASP